MKVKATFLMTLHTAGPLQHFACGIFLKKLQQKREQIYDG